MTVTDWRAWTSQNGGSQPGQSSPFPFPGVGPIPYPDAGQPTPATSVPPYSATPVTINAIDPFYVPVGTTTNGGGWVAKMGDYWYDWAGTIHTWPAGSPGSAVPAGPIMRPAIPGLTS